MKALLLATALSLPAMAAYAESAGSGVKVEPYDPLKREFITVQVGRMVNITFSPQERIKQVFLVSNGPILDAGKKEGGAQNPLINNLPLVGAKVGTTNFIVITELPNDMERTYQIVARVVPGPENGEAPDATFDLVYSYGGKPAVAQNAIATTQASGGAVAKPVYTAAQVAAWKQKQADDKARAEQEHMEGDPLYGPQNDHYIIQGRSDLAPKGGAADNGYLTWFNYPGNTSRPSVFIVNDRDTGVPAVCSGGKPTGDEKSEETAPTSYRGDLLVVQRVVRHLRLRDGQKVADIYNCGPLTVGWKPNHPGEDPQFSVPNQQQRVAQSK